MFKLSDNCRCINFAAEYIKQLQIHFLIQITITLDAGQEELLNIPIII